MNQAQSAPADGKSASRSSRRRLRFELIFASVWLAIGLFALPAGIFSVGTRLLGPYGEGRGVGRFYADFYADLTTPSGRAWVIALGPLALITVLRLVFVGAAGSPGKHFAPHDDDSPEDRGQRRVEPRIGHD